MNNRTKAEEVVEDRYDKGQAMCTHFPRNVEQMRERLKEIIANSKGCYDAHHIDIVVRRDGKDEWYEADFLKSFASGEMEA